MVRTKYLSASEIQVSSYITLSGDNEASCD